MPSVMGAHVTYTPRAEGLAEITAAVIERPVLPTTAPAAGAVAVHAAIDRELEVEISSPTGGGERWLASWRWWESRPRVFAGVEAPAPFGGIWQLSGTDERESYGSGSDFTEEERRSLSIAATDWISANVKWDAELRAERWPSSDAAGALGGLRYQSVDAPASGHPRPPRGRPVSSETGGRTLAPREPSGSRVPVSMPRARRRHSHCGVEPGTATAAPHCCARIRCCTTGSSATGSSAGCWPRAAPSGGAGVPRYSVSCESHRLCSSTSRVRTIRPLSPIPVPMSTSVPEFEWRSRVLA
jgi:hypothetical protein